jgi:carboxymethylenebutenolidase
MTKPSQSRPAVTAEMIRAYDEYTHLTLDRRRFMERLTQLAGSGAAAAAIAPLLGASTASAQIVAGDDDRLVAQDVDFAGPQGTIAGYLVRPVDQQDALPAVMVIHENRGLNEHIRDVARRLALEGFVALAPDFLSPAGGTPDDEDEARTMIGSLQSDATVANAVAAASYLQQLEGSNGQVGAIGFCWGGGLVNDLAAAAPALGAGVVYYGRQGSAEQAGTIEAAMLFHYGGLDERINAGIAGYEAALSDAGVQFESHVYEGVNHAFNNDTSAARYDEEAASLSWERTVAFLKTELGGG